MSRRWWIAIGVLVALSCASPKPSTQAGAPPRTGPGQSKSTPVPVGSPVEVAKGWSVQVNKASLDADAELKTVNQFNTPSAGKQFVTVNITVMNGGDKPGTTPGNLKLSVLGPSGAATSEKFCGEIPGRFDTSSQLQPGGTATGTLCFEVPKDGAAQSVLLAEPQFTVDRNEDQRFFALS